MFETSMQGAVMVVKYDQPLVSASLEAFDSTLRPAFRGGQPMVVLNMEAIPLIDSAALEKLLETSEIFLRNGGRFRIAQPNQLCADALRITGLDRRLEVFSVLADAVGSFLK